MLVHSYIYYVKNDNIISDDEWQRRANELAELIKQYGYETGAYDDQFMDWDGTTGMHLKFDGWTISKSLQLMRDFENRI